MNVRSLSLICVAALFTAAVFGVGHAQPGSDASGTAANIVLPAPKTVGTVSVEQALAQRRSVRSFAAKELTLDQIGQLAWAAQGITEPKRGLRTAPSAGAIYPLEVYLAKSDGVFRYLPQGHQLQQVTNVDKRSELSPQASVRNAPVDFVIAGNFERMRAKFGANTDRFVYIEAGHVGQNIHLQAVALGLASVSVGGFDPAAATQALNLPTDETVIYIIPVGYPKQDSGLP